MGCVAVSEMYCIFGDDFSRALRSINISKIISFVAIICLLKQNWWSLPKEMEIQYHQMGKLAFAASNRQDATFVSYPLMFQLKPTRFRSHTSFSFCFLFQKDAKPGNIGKKIWTKQAQEPLKKMNRDGQNLTHIISLAKYIRAFVHLFFVSLNVNIDMDFRNIIWYESVRDVNIGSDIIVSFVC